MEQKLSNTLVKVIDRSNPMMQNLQLASRFNKLVEQGGGGGGSANLEDNKKISITKNGKIEITPTGGKDGMKKVTATVNVPKEVVLNVPVLPDGFTIRKEASQGNSLVISSPTAFSYFSVEPTGTYKDGKLNVTEGSLGNVDRNSYICIFSDSNYNTLIGMGRWSDYEALTN